MADLEVEVSPGDFRDIRLGSIIPLIDERLASLARPWGSLALPTMLYIEADKGVRTGRWVAMKMGFHPDYKLVIPARFIPEYPPIAMNNAANPAAARVPIGSQS